MAATAETLTAEAIALGYGSLSYRGLLECLLYTVQSGGGGGGSEAVTQGSGPPVAPPADPTRAALYTDTDSGDQYYWNILNQAWA